LKDFLLLNCSKDEEPEAFQDYYFLEAERAMDLENY